MKRSILRSIAILALFVFLLNLVIPTAFAINEKSDKEDETEQSEITEATDKTEKTVEENNKIDTNSQINIQDNDQKEDDTNEENKIMTMNLKNNKVSDGVYKISTALDSNKYLDISAGLTTDSANVQIWQKDNVLQQKFKITYSNGYYTIMAIHSSKYLDVEGAGKTNWTNVQQYRGNGTDAQKWQIKDAGDGYFYIISKCSGLYLDVANASNKNGTNVHIFAENKTKAQKFKLEEIKPMESKRELATDGVYKIKPKSGGCLDISAGSKSDSANLQVWQSDNVEQQKFEIKWKNGYYEIKAVHSQKVLDVEGAGQAKGTNVQQYKSNETDAQKWILKKAEGDYYYIISKCNELYLDVSGGSNKNGTNVQVYTGNGTDAQKFKLEKPAVYTGDIPNGTYRISTGLSYDRAPYKNMALDISAGSKAAGANVQIWGNTNVLQQKFKLTLNVENGYYLIEPTHVTGMALQVSGTNVIQNTKNANLDSQLWKIEKLKDGYFTIKSKSTGLYLDVHNANTADGTNVKVYQRNDTTSAQKWKIENVYFGIDISYEQGDINANALINSKRADFAIMRLGFSEDNVSGGRKITETHLLGNASLPGERINYSKLKGKIPLGAYIYTYADSLEDAKNEAYAVVNLIKENKWNFELPIFFDIEDKKQANLSPILRTSMCKAFCEILKNNGLKPGIYSNVDKLNTWINVNELPSYVSIWAAGYGHNDSYVPVDKYKFAKNHDIWQYCDTGTIDGIAGAVDVNITFKKMW